MFTLETYSAVSSIITGPLNFLYIAILTLEWRFSKRTMRILIPAFLGLMSFGNAVYFVIYGVNGDTKLTVAVATIVMIITFNLFVSRYPLLQLMSTYVSACIFTFVSDTICGILVPQAGLAHVLIKIIIYLVGAALLICFFRRPLLDVQREVQRRKWLWIMVVPLLMCLIFFYVVQMQGPLYGDSSFRPVALALCFCAICVYIYFYFVLRSLQKQYRMQSETAVLQVHLSSLKKHAETMKTMNDQIQLMQHDLRHYINMQSMCLDNGDIGGMRESLAAMSSHMSDILDSHCMHQYTGQPLIDAVLSYYADCAETEGIAYKFTLDLPDEIGDTSELAVTLSNAVENAYHACLSMSANEKREIQINGGIQNSQLAIEIINTYSGEMHFDEDGYPAAQRVGHGYGTQSIISYIKKNHGLVCYKAENGWFRVQLLIPMK